MQFGTSDLRNYNGTMVESKSRYRVNSEEHDARMTHLNQCTDTNVHCKRSRELETAGTVAIIT
jgi:hypothetical protein